MSLVAASSSGSSSSNPPKTISVEVSSSTVLYTVPSGRKFVGQYNVHYSSSTSAMQLISPTGSTISFYFGNERTPAYPLTLYEGWSIRSWSYNASMLGIESDA